MLHVSETLLDGFQTISLHRKDPQTSSVYFGGFDFYFSLPFVQCSERMTSSFGAIELAEVLLPLDILSWEAVLCPVLFAHVKKITIFIISVYCNFLLRFLLSFQYMISGAVSFAFRKNCTFSLVKKKKRKQNTAIRDNILWVKYRSAICISLCAERDGEV